MFRAELFHCSDGPFLVYRRVSGPGVEVFRIFVLFEFPDGIFRLAFCGVSCVFLIGFPLPYSSLKEFPPPPPPPDGIAREDLIKTNITSYFIFYEAGHLYNLLKSTKINFKNSRLPFSSLRPCMGAGWIKAASFAAVGMVLFWLVSLGADFSSRTILGDDWISLEKASL